MLCLIPIILKVTFLRSSLKRFSRDVNDKDIFISSSLGLYIIYIVIIDRYFVGKYFKDKFASLLTSTSTLVKENQCELT